MVLRTEGTWVHESPEGIVGGLELRGFTGAGDEPLEGLREKVADNLS